jgi:hypothetical protein
MYLQRASRNRVEAVVLWSQRKDSLSAAKWLDELRDN